MYEIRQTGQFQKWQARLKDRLVQAQIVARIDRLALGHFGDSKQLGDRVTELRIHLGPGYPYNARKHPSSSALWRDEGDTETGHPQSKRAREALERIR